MGKLKRILIVDEDDQVRDLMHRVLKRMGDGYRIQTAQNNREALAMVKKVPFDLMIADLRMPSMNGLRLTEQIRALSPDTFVIWVTAFGCYRVRDEARDLAVCDCLDKPIEIAEIRRAVCEALEAPRRSLKIGKEEAAVID